MRGGQRPTIPTDDILVSELRQLDGLDGLSYSVYGIGYLLNLHADSEQQRALYVEEWLTVEEVCDHAILMLAGIDRDHATTPGVNLLTP